MSESLGHAVAIRDEDERGSNRSGNPHIQDMIDARVSRRRFLGGTVAVAATSFLGGITIEPLTAQAGNGHGPDGVLGFLDRKSDDCAFVINPFHDATAATNGAAQLVHP